MEQRPAMGLSVDYGRNFRRIVFQYELHRRVAGVRRLYRNHMDYPQIPFKQGPVAQRPRPFTDYMSGFFPIILFVFVCVHLWPNRSRFRQARCGPDWWLAISSS